MSAPKKPRKIVKTLKPRVTSIYFDVPILTVSEANMREHWAAKAKRAKSQRSDMYTFLMAFAKSVKDCARPHHKSKWVVAIKRVGIRRLDDDNLAGSAKHVRDEIAAWMGCDDGPDGPITWSYDQYSHSTAECGLMISITRCCE